MYKDDGGQYCEIMSKDANVFSLDDTGSSNWKTYVKIEGNLKMFMDRALDPKESQISTLKTYARTEKNDAQNEKE